MNFPKPRIDCDDHYSLPIILRIDVKNGIKDSSVKEQIDAVKQAEVLVLDDIGAEQFLFLD